MTNAGMCCVRSSSVAAVAVFAAMHLGCSAEGQRAQASAAPATAGAVVGRYQVVSIAIDKRPMLLDTTTGAMWTLCDVGVEKTALAGDQRAKDLGLAQWWCQVAAEPISRGKPNDPLGIR